MTFIERQIGFVTRVEPANFAETGDCRGADYLAAHPEAQERAQAALEMLGANALRGAAQDVQDVLVGAF